MPLYHCNNCQKSFEQATGKPRCPDCLRRHGIEQSETAAKGKERLGAQRKRRQTTGTRRRLPWALGLSLVVLLTLLALVFVRSRTDLPQPGQLAILDEAVLRQTLIQRGVPSDRLIDPFKRGTAIAALAGKAVSGEVKQKLKTLISRVAPKLRTLRVDLSGHYDHAVRGAEAFAGQIAQGKADRAYSLELAFVVTAVLRQHGFAAVIAEAHGLEAPVRSASANAATGRYLVAVYPTGKLGQTPLATLDPTAAAPLPPWAGGGEDAEMASKADESTPLDDASAVGHLMSLRALQWSRSQKKLPEAYEQAQLAVKAASPSATLLMAQAMVLAASGGLNDAVGKARAALARRNDAPRATALARLLLATGNASEAVKLLEDALKKDQAYWPALESLTILRWIARERDAGNAFLDQALKIAPDELSILQLQGSRRMSEDNCEAASRIFRRVNQDLATDQSRLQLYICLLKLGKTDEARLEREQLLKNATDVEGVKQALASIEGGDQAPAPASGNAGQAAPADLAPPPARREPAEIKLPDVNLGSP